MRDQVFISYSHRDAAWLERLQVYLAPFERRGQLRRWDDTLIAPGERWAQEINEALGRARVAVLLVSAQFLASDFIARVELPRLLGAAEDQGVAILPLVIDWCNFERIPELAQFQSLNPPSQPLETMSESDAKAVLARLAAAVADTLQDGDVVGCERGRLVGLPARNPLFTGRDALLATLGEQLAGGGRVALCGIAGIGKTEAAIEYAHRYRNRHAWVLWSRAESIQPLLRGFCAIAAAFGLPEARGSDQLVMAQAARRALSACGDWLLVLDSADDLSILRDWLPEGDGGTVIVTSRSSALGGIAQAIDLDPLDEASAAHFLLRRAALCEPEGAAAADLLAPAIDIARLAGGLPLALDQAGSYIEETGCTLAEYVGLWCEHRIRLLAERGEAGLREGVSLIDAWSLSLAELQRANPNAAALLRLLSFCHCDCLPDDALRIGAAFAGPDLAPILADGLARNDAYRDAQRFAFVRRDVKTGRRAMHRLVQTVLRDTLSDKERELWCMRALEVLNAALPEPRFANWAACDKLAAHGLAALEQAESLGIATGAGARLACEIGAYFGQRGRYAEALPLAERGLAERSRSTDTPPRELARALTVCGQIELGMGRLVPARARLEAAAGALRPGGASVELARVIDMLGTVDTAAGELLAGRARLSDAVAMIAVAGAAESIEAAQIANDLGAVQFKTGNYTEARAAFERAAQLRQMLLPGNHPSVAQSLNNLAAVCARLGQHNEARSRYCQALALRQAAFGERHPDVAETLLNLALLDLSCGRTADARDEAAQAVNILHACYGDAHAATARARACLGDVALAAGELDEAQQLYGMSREVRTALLGSRHPETARAIVGLADVALARGDNATAAALLSEALDVMRERLGATRPDVRACEAELERARAVAGADTPAVIERTGT
ncbi:MAG TPA: FxSxx-COOH system tetratricopeptide repeat protein [Rhodocyclaceae bacterium]|nr:FxSxx-COOH system tetratricopeptide repeat protein [Rhodocyclaceae bacterium]